ncbi:MAG TPA: hypothetical protein P5328_01125 [Candidatus Paceibacterota bacterium]|nr:hypothetical protein [Candidatus Paceibacterota bacterium]HRZ34588.1 hypothetical protein [Candidatus Paceibacterota bacterium]
MSSVDSFLSKIASVIVNPLIRLLFAVALVVFLWGIFNYIKGASNPEARETGRRHIIWGLIGMLIMVSVFGIIKLALDTIYG